MLLIIVQKYLIVVLLVYLVFLNFIQKHLFVFILNNYNAPFLLIFKTTPRIIPTQINFK